jgi:ElaB/YqjD/DUF883 family membrane-anchored ribosome-binding protein
MVASAAVLVATALQGCSHEDLVHAICAATTGDAFTDLKDKMLETIDSHCNTSAAKDTDGRRLVPPDVKKAACARKGELEVDARVRAEQENLTQECIAKYANMSVSDLANVDRLKNMTKQFMDDQSSVLKNFRDDAVAKATQIADEAHKIAADAQDDAQDVADDAQEKSPDESTKLVSATPEAEAAAEPSQEKPPEDVAKSRLYDMRLSSNVVPARVLVPVFISLTALIAVVGLAFAFVVRLSRHSQMDFEPLFCEEGEEESRLQCEK